MKENEATSSFHPLFTKLNLHFLLTPISAWTPEIERMGLFGGNGVWQAGHKQGSSRSYDLNVGDQGANQMGEQWLTWLEFCPTWFEKRRKENSKKTNPI